MSKMIQSYLMKDKVNCSSKYQKSISGKRHQLTRTSPIESTEYLSPPIFQHYHCHNPGGLQQRLLNQTSNSLCLECCSSFQPLIPDPVYLVRLLRLCTGAPNF
eukprot:737235-Amorphochlora_amoeboformis.AAC.3